MGLYGRLGVQMPHTKKALDKHMVPVKLVKGPIVTTFSTDFFNLFFIHVSILSEMETQNSLK